MGTGQTVQPQGVEATASLPYSFVFFEFCFNLDLILPKQGSKFWLIIQVVGDTHANIYFMASIYIYTYIVGCTFPIITSPITHTTAIEDFKGKSSIVGEKSHSDPSHGE